MNFSAYKKNKQKKKLLSSKYIYSHGNSLPQINTLKIALIFSGQEAALTAAFLAVLFGQKPAFIKSKINRTLNFRLQQVIVSLAGIRAHQTFPILSQSIIPFQQENELIEVTPANRSHFS
jgi:hypothetical protein